MEKSIYRMSMRFIMVVMATMMVAVTCVAQEKSNPLVVGTTSGLVM